MAYVHLNLQSHSGAWMSVAAYETPKLTYLGHIYEAAKRMKIPTRMEMLNSYWRAKRALWLDHKKQCGTCCQSATGALVMCDAGKEMYNEMDVAAKRAIQGA